MLATCPSHEARFGGLELEAPAPDEASVAPGPLPGLLGEFEQQLASASIESRYKRRDDKSVRLFGGYNFLGFGDFYQIPPIPADWSLAIPPMGKKT